jgi:hypothetical protein
VDLLEVSGGTYEQPRLIGFEGRSEDAVPVRRSTRAREAYFLEYATAIRRVARMPLMVTGGFRTRAGMAAALGAAPGEGDRGWLSPQGTSVAAKALNAFAAQSWYYCQLFRLAEGKSADISRGVFSTLREYLGAELKAAYATRRVYPRG